jgi:hypothetical protein
MFSNHVHKIIILPTLVIRISNLEIFLFCQHNSTGGGNLELRQTISLITNKLWSFFATLGHPVYIPQYFLNMQKKRSYHLEESKS